MNTKEKIQFIASSDYVSNLHENNLDFENHNRLFWCHLACMVFLTTGIKEFFLDLNYSYLLSASKNSNKKLGMMIDFGGINFYTTNNSLIQFNNHCTRNSLKLNNSILGKKDCFSFKNAFEDYINSNIKLKDLDFDSFEKSHFNLLFLKFKINNRKSIIEQEKFLTFLHSQCPEMDYFLNYLQHKEKFSRISSITEKKLKI